MTTLQKQFETARRTSVPMLVVRSMDQIATIEHLTQDSDGKTLEDHPLVKWDGVRGLTGINKKGTATLAALKIKSDETIGFPEALVRARELPQGAVVFAFNAHRQLTASEPLSVAQSVQAVANLREEFKANFRMLVMMGPAMAVPMELEQDVIIFNHPLPDETSLATIVKNTYKAAKMPPPKPEVVNKAVDALSGLSAFSAEQNAALNLEESGLNIATLWESKRVSIEQTPGLTVWRGKEKFSDIIGQDALKAHLRRRINAKRPLGVVVWIDEIDKALANVEQDSSGVRMYQLLKLLTEMENNEWPGFVGVGVAGGGKSLIAKALGNEAGVPTIGLDFGATESKYVGESEANLLRLIGIIKAVGRGNAYFVATSNAATVMRPELQRRFTDGMWMFDLMTNDERQATWAFYLKRYELKAQPLPDDDAWTGAEIRNCARYAYETNSTLLDSAKLVVPMARSRAKEVERLRTEAHGKFLDVHHGGTYAYQPASMEKQLRAIQLDPKIIPSIVGMTES